MISPLMFSPNLKKSLSAISITVFPYSISPEISSGKINIHLFSTLIFTYNIPWMGTKKDENSKWKKRYIKNRALAESVNKHEIKLNSHDLFIIVLW